MSFLLGIIIAIFSSLLQLIGVPINSVVGTLFLLFMVNPYIALGYWSASQGLIMCQTIGELYYTQDKDLDNTDSVVAERRAGNLTILIPHLYRFELFLTVFKCAALFLIAQPEFVLNNPAIKLGIYGLSIVLATIILFIVGHKLITEYSFTQRVVYLLTIIAVIILFKIITYLNIGVLNSIPLLLGISFMELPSLYGGKTKKVQYYQKDNTEFIGTLDWLNPSYLFLVFLSNLGIGTSKLTNYLNTYAKHTSYDVLNIYAGKHIAAFTSSLLYMLLGSNRSALEETVSLVDNAYLVNNVGLLIGTIGFFCYVSHTYKGFFIDLANSPLNDLQKTICSIGIITVLVLTSLWGTPYNTLLAVVFIGLAIGFNVVVNYIKLPNSALSFITMYVPITGLIFK